MPTPLIPVRKRTLVIGDFDTTSDQIDFTDKNRFGENVVGGMITNMGADSVLLDGIITLATGDSIPIGVQYPYKDCSNWTVQFLAGAGAPSRRLVIVFFNAYTE